MYEHTCGYMADDSWVASTLMADTRTNSCGVADIRNVYPFPEVKGGTLNDAYPITSFSYKCKSSITLTSNIDDFSCEIILNKKKRNISQKYK